MIYFLANTRAMAIKIGTSRDVSVRLGSLLTASPDPLEVIGVIPGDRRDEAAWHARWHRLRIRREWFKAEPGLVDEIGNVLAVRAEYADVASPAFQRLAALEPGLRQLFRRAVGLKAAAVFDPDFCANKAWYGRRDQPGLKASLRGLVGFKAHNDHPELVTHRAYDVAYQTIYAALPRCKEGCVCQAFYEECCQ